MQTDYKEKSTITVDENDILKMSAKIQQNKSENAVFRKQLDKYFSGAMPSHEVINVCSTPNVLKLLNSTAKKVVLNQKDLENAVSADKSGNTGHTEGHNISKEELYKLSDEIRNPIMILKGNERNKNSVVLITDMVNKNGENVFVPIALDRQNGKISNISTLYGKNNLSKYIAEHKSEILSLNIEKTGMLADTGVQFSQSIYDTVTCYGNSIAYSTQNVKHPEKNIHDLSGQNIKRDILSELHADIDDDGNFKVNHEYYSSLPRSERAIEQFPADKAIEIMQQLNDNSIEFSATSRKNNMAAITVSKSDLDSLHKYAEKVLSAAQSNEEIENSNKLEIVSNSPDDMKSLFSIEQNGETRYYLNNGNSMRDLLEKCSADTPYAALMKCGEQISEERFAEIQQGKNFAFSLDINFDEDSVSIYKVKGGVSEIDRNDNNSVIKSFKLSEITENFAQTSEEKKTSSISEKINPEYYNQLKKDERKVIRLPHNSGDKAISALQSAGIPFSAVKSEKLTSITVHKDNAQVLDQIISDGSKQTAKEYINSDFFKSLPPEERLYTQISGTDKANELMSELKNNNIGFSAVIDKEKNSAKVTVAKKDTSALKKVTDSLFSRKAQKDFSDKAKSMNQEQNTRNIAKNKDNQHSI
ncbi:MAG: hypothetical protein NC247_05815 [Ruminococcus flavefaciens]|nr:hypothetical protein [Ruminococcus flavefaciens]MCM1361788.1 hypothetical protein [Clostridiales bacterium]MCM1435637.1 hypothetical protein [Ruminococcus flavefaciens]